MDPTVQTNVVILLNSSAYRAFSFSLSRLSHCSDRSFGPKRNVSPYSASVGEVFGVNLLTYTQSSVLFRAHDVSSNWFTPCYLLLAYFYKLYLQKHIYVSLGFLLIIWCRNFSENYATGGSSSPRRMIRLFARQITSVGWSCPVFIVI